MPVPTETVIRAWARLVRAREAIVESVETDLKSAGFPPLGWYDALLELNYAEGKELRPFELEAKLKLPQYHVSRLVDRLARAGYVEKRRIKGDGRGLQVALSDAGRALLLSMWPAYAAAIEAHVGSRLTAGEAAQLAHLLGRLDAGGEA